MRSAVPSPLLVTLRLVYYDPGHSSTMCVKVPGQRVRIRIIVLPPQVFRYIERLSGPIATGPESV